MPQSYLTADRFGAFDRAFGVGVQLGTQIVRDRQERQQKLEDFARQQQAEREAEDHRAQLQLQNHAAELAQKSAQDAQDAKAASANPVAGRQKIWDDQVAAKKEALDAQYNRAAVALNPEVSGYTQEGRKAAQQMTQRIQKQYEDLLAARPTTWDAATPVVFPNNIPAFDLSPDNEITSLPAEQLYTPEYRASLTKAGGGMTPYQQYLVSKDEQNRRDKRVNTAHGSIKATIGALNLLNMSGDDPNADPMDPASAAKAKTNNANRTKASAAYAQNVNGAISALTDPEVIAAKAGVDPETAKVYANALKNKLASSFTNGVPTPSQFGAFMQSVRTHGGDSPVAKAVLAITNSPYSGDATETPTATPTASGPPAQTTDDTEETQ